MREENSKKMNSPKTVEEVRSILDRASFKPSETLLAGLLTGVVTGQVAWLLWSDQTLSSLTDYLLVTTAVVFVLGLKKVPLITHGVIILLGRRIFRQRFEDGKKALLSEGWHWLPPLISYSKNIDTEESHVEVESQDFVVPHPKGKKSGIVVRFTDTQANFRVWHPFLLLETGEADVVNEIVGIINETIRSYANKEVNKGAEEEGVEKIFGADVDKKVKKALQKDKNAGRWGIIIISVATPGIGFATEQSRIAFESLYAKQREQETELTEWETVQVITDELLEKYKSLSEEDALITAQRISDNLRKSDIFFHQKGGNVSDIVKAAALHGLLGEGGGDE